jgi:rhodanese-related sulfurtransferase
MIRRHRFLSTASLLAGLALVALLSSCGSDGGEAADAAPTAEPSGASIPAPGQEAAEAAKTDGRTAIDVRTPEEYAAGHVDGATLVNFQDPGFAAAIEELDPEVDYVVYCRSGNRSAQAATQMRAIGLDVTDGGALTDMAAAGWPTA